MFLKYSVILCLLHSIVALKATEYCPSVKEDQLTWPKTAAGGKVYSEEYCFTEKGLRLARLCVDDTVNGPHWADVTEDCQIQVVSSIAQDLMTLDTELWNRTIVQETFYDEVIELTNKYEQFNAFDVYVTYAVVFHSLPYYTARDPVHTFQIFDNILRMDSKVLAEAQTRMRTTEAWFATMLDVTSYPTVNNYVANRTNFEVSITGSGFIYTGAIVEDFGNEKNFSTIGKCLETFDSVLKRENLEVAVWVVPPPVDYTDKHTFIFYWNDVNAFFYDKSTPVENIKQVVSVWQNTQNYGISTKRVILRFDENTYDQNIQCASWEERNETQGSWKITGEFSIQNSCFICTYTLISEAFAFILAPEQTVTESLTELLTSSSSTEILSRLLQYSARYDEFEVADVTLTGQLLKKISASNDLNLEILHKILDNLHNINKTVLAESRMKNKSTDAILYYADVIFKNNVYTSDLHAEAQVMRPDDICS